MSDPRTTLQTGTDIRVFTFIRTDVESPADIDQSCLTIDNSTLGTKYLGITLSILKVEKNHTCRPQNMELKKIRKSIIIDKQDRRVCRTEFTLSFNKEQCERTVQYICQGNHTKQIYFQECKKLDVKVTEKETEDDSESIIMSELLVSGVTEEGPVYEIPRTRCNIKRLNSESVSTNQVTSYEETTFSRKENQEHPEEGYGVFAVLGSGLAGLTSGVLITSLTCILIQKCKQSRNVNDVLSPESTLHLMVGRERKFSIHSKEEETTYHDISDIPGPSKGKAKCTLQSITNVQNNDEYMEQRYSESPKSSTSVNGNGSLSSSKNIKFQTNEPSVSIQRGQVYHTLSKDEDIGSTKKEKLSTSDSLSSPKTPDERASSKIGMIQTITSENNGLNPRDITNVRSAEPNDDPCLETPQNTTEALPGLYHVLQEKKDDQGDSESSNIEK
uniref:Uncharacterized protein LOC111110035 n=1 Tax=Crassostrea virginica TaxID=6565 RepID=A0A8B8BFD3_CRAVI|nr:uncharacterized protein LOC111110035 [Crassostrea virginica]